MIDGNSTTTFSSSSSSFTSSTTSCSDRTDLIRPHPHRRSDPHWSAIRAAAALSPDGSLHLHQLKIIKQLGSGNLARVFHCRLVGDSPSSDFALKMVDTDALARVRDGQEKLSHVMVEGDVLSSMDHPFLPTLYARLDSPRHTSFLIEYCPGGDLHTLLRRQPGGRFPLQAARFYAAETLLALEYLHCSGYIYRDLKPENILRRSDGHLMLSDFDLCLKADVVPSLHHIKPEMGMRRRKKKNQTRIASGILSIFTCYSTDNMELEGEERLVLVTEPQTASSLECVGTHEYLAPEVLTREGHGNAVDWWAFGVFLYEMICGRTPFVGRDKESTLKNIKSKPLRFSEVMTGDDDLVMTAARDLIKKLLDKDPNKRLGTIKGAAVIKMHPFFDGIKWPLLRNYPAPRVTSRSMEAAGKCRGRSLMSPGG